MSEADIMATECVWNESCSVGDAEMDRQHRELLERAASMPSSFDARQIRASILDMRSSLEKHFASEERHMRSLGYPRLEAHCGLHAQLMRCLDAIVAHPRARSDAPFSLRELLMDWFVGHILSEDRDYARFACVRGRGVGNRMGDRPAPSVPELRVEPLTDREMEGF